MTESSARGRTLRIERLAQRGEGAVRTDGGVVLIPYALPGDEILAEVDGERGRLLEVLSPSPDRIAPFCAYYGVCGGCAVQALAPAPYAAWKRDAVVGALAHAKIDAHVGALVDAHGDGRRRATFHARTLQDALGRTRVEVGFMRARAHDIVDIDDCPVLSPDMAGAPRAAHAIAKALQGTGKPLDILVTATESGLDVDVRGCGDLADFQRQTLIAEAARLDLARISNHGIVLIERRAPVLSMGRAKVTPPPGAFLQATREGEATLARLVSERVGKVKRAADLFCGVGTFAFRLAEVAQVHAVETERVWMGAVVRGSGDAGPLLKPITTEVRDLFKRPLAAADLADYQAVVFDPPRAGAEAQARELALSQVPTVVAVSCNPQTFARDARILIDGGYVMGEVTPVDQFRHSPHVEVVAAFTKARPKGRKGRLLG
ncbi:MAG: methyltransferase [Hyphomicrobiales bacterium]|nr:methyltransferase [Hyphomicrobiales bacterium]